MNGTPHVEREMLQQDLLRILQRLSERGNSLASPPPPVLAEFRHRIASNVYTVLVVGEAKRGKSTFVNALIGRPVLPTAVEIATSQVFQITLADEPSFHLRFEDDSWRPIGEEDLARFGSQVATDAGETPRLDQVIRWIEVAMPARFIPPGVRLLDTPGLGSLHLQHAEITQRFVPYADAVIYTLESGRPLGQIDLDFLKAIVAATPNIFFIQTMIDRYRRAEWQEVQQRNQVLLAERFGDRLTDTRVWPVSSTLLLKGVETDDGDYVQASRQEAMLAALQTFLFRIAGLERLAQALAVADSYHRRVHRALAAQLTALGEQTKEQRAAAQQRVARRREQFEAEWGERGVQRGRLLESVRRTSGTAKQGFAQILQPGSELLLEPEARIAAITSIHEANTVGQQLAADIVATIAAAWQNICAQAEARCQELLQPLVDEALALEVAQEIDPAAIDTGVAPDTFKDDWWLRIRSAYSNTSFLVGLGSIVPGLGSIAHLAALWNVVRGSWSGADNPQVKLAQQELRKHLGLVVQRVRRHFLDVDLATGRSSLVDEYFLNLERTFMERAQLVVRRQAEQAQAEATRLIEAARLDDRQRAEQVAALQQTLADWEVLGRDIETMVARLQHARISSG